MRVKIVILLITSFVLVTLFTSISADENIIPNQGLISYYNFNEGAGNILHDSSGHNYDGTIFEESWTDGIDGTALEFNGINSYVNLPASTLSNWDSLTSAFWVKAPKYSGSGWPAFFGSHTTNPTNNICVCISRNTETIHLEIDTDNGNYETSGDIKIPGDTWFHVAMVYDGEQLIEYINGVRGISIPATGNLKNVSELNIGQLGNNRYFFKGVIDEAYVYNRALTSTEINQLYNHGISGSSSYYFKENNAIKQSPLNIILPKETVPIAATIITITTIGLWQLFGGLFIDFFSDYSSEKIIDSKGSKRNYSNRLDRFNIPFIPLSTTELFHILIAVIVFSIALSWTWGSSINQMVTLFLLNIAIIGIIYIFRELLRIHYSSKLNIQTNHVLWPFGTILTIISSFLGNTFSLASYNTAENEEDGRYAQLLFNSNIIFYSIASVFFIMNLLVSHVVFQMVFIFLIMTLTIDMTPLKPLDGAIIRKWNTKKFMVLYIIILVSYIFMIFII